MHLNLVNYLSIFGASDTPIMLQNTTQALNFEIKPIWRYASKKSSLTGNATVMTDRFLQAGRQYRFER